MSTSSELNTKGAELALSIERILTRLTDCLNRETEAVKSSDTRAVTALQEEKLSLMEQYQSLSERLNRENGSLNDLDTNIREHLRAVSTAFQDALTRNLIALQAGHQAVTRLMDRIMTTARRTIMQDQQKYNAKGALADAPGGITIPTKLNETL